MKRSNIDELYEEKPVLTCCMCGKSLLEEPEMAIVKIVSRIGKDGVKRIEKYMPCCKGACDNAIPVGRGCDDGWWDLTDFINPALREKIWFGMLNNMHKKKLEMSEEAREGFADVMDATLSLSIRDMTEKEKRCALMIMNNYPFF